MRWSFEGILMLLLGIYIALMSLGIFPVPVKAWQKEADRQTTRRILPFLGTGLVLAGVFHLLGWLQ